MNKKNDKIEIIHHEPIDDDFAAMGDGEDEIEEQDGDDIADALGALFADSIEAESLCIDDVSEKDMKNLEKDVQKLRKKKALEAEHGFHYEPKCYCCNLAIDDPDIHKIYLLSKQRPGAVQKYISEKYGKKVKWESVDTHMKDHFLPVYDEISYKRRDHLLNVKRWIKEREDSIYPSKLAVLEEIMMQKAENIAIRSSGQPVEIEIMASKVIPSLASAIVKIQDFRLQMVGSNKSPEEMNKITQEAFKGLVQKALENLPEQDRLRLASLIQKQISGGGF